MSATANTLKSSDYKRIQQLIFSLAGITIPDGKQVMVQGRIAKRMRELTLNSADDYLSLLEQRTDRNELQLFVNCLTTNKTDFFREEHHFKFLAKQVFPLWLKNNKPLRIWSSACSTGEEPYSIAISAFESSLPSDKFQIIATDIDTDVLRHAINGTYPEDRVCDMPKHTLLKYFSREKGDGVSTWKVTSELQQSIQFKQFNLNSCPWQFQNCFDVIFCRNVMIYFSLETQRNLIAKFADALSPGGYLAVGHSESLYGISDQFEPIGDTVYKLKPHVESKAKQSINQPAVGSLQNRQPEVAKSTIDSMTTSSRPESFKSIIVGEVFASKQPIWITTLLGSCIAACLYDSTSGVGGMNHFMLPRSGNDNRTCASFGVHAMEMLINEMMKLGADRRRLKAKIFGGGAVIQADSSKWNVGERNIEFIHKFLKDEGIPIVAHHLGGDCARQVRFHTGTQKALVKPLSKSESSSVAKREQSSTCSPVQTNQITLF